MSAKKPDELKKILFEEPPRPDVVLVLGKRLQDTGVHSAMAEPTAQFLGHLYAEAVNFVRLVAPLVRNPDKAGPDTAEELRRSAVFIELQSKEALPFLERTSAVLDRKVEEDDDATEAFEKSVARMEKLGRLDDAGPLMTKICSDAELAHAHGSWALANIYLALVKLIGIIELTRFERVSASTMSNAIAEILLDTTHRLRPGLVGTEEGRSGLLELLGAASSAKS